MAMGYDKEESQPLVDVITSFRSDITQPITWEVVNAPGGIGAHVDFVKHILAAPLSGDDQSKYEQIEQLIVARVSPVDPDIYTSIIKSDAVYDSITSNLLKAAEKARVSKIARVIAETRGLKLDVDASTKQLGKRLATANTVEAWDKAVEFTIQHSDTKEFNSFCAGIRSINPEWSKTLRGLNARVERALSGEIIDAPNSLSSTKPLEYTGPNGNGTYPQGFSNSIYVAYIASEYFSGNYHAPCSVQELHAKRDKEKAAKYGEDKIHDEYGKEIGEISGIDTSDIPDDYTFDTEIPMSSDGYPTDDGHGKFAELLIDDTLPLTEEVRGYMRRKRKAMVTGRHFTYPQRMVTDPYRRVFSSKVKVKGGVVVIDISGSMSLTDEDIDAIVEAAPAALILAYSHSKQNLGKPNAWILANRGWRVKNIKGIGNVGNGVDGPALTWAIRHRKPGEDIIWVCDGQVTDRFDHGSNELAKQCAKLVKKHKIIMIHSVEEAIHQFKTGKIVNNPTGRVREALLNRL